MGCGLGLRLGLRLGFGLGLGLLAWDGSYNSGALNSEERWIVPMIHVGSAGIFCMYTSKVYNGWVRVQYSIGQRSTLQARVPRWNHHWLRQLIRTMNLWKYGRM